MFTLKFTDQDGYERLSSGYDIRHHRAEHGQPKTCLDLDGRERPCVDTLTWIDADTGRACCLFWPTTVYVMNESGATVGKYVMCAPSKEGE